MAAAPTARETLTFIIHDADTCVEGSVTFTLTRNEDEEFRWDDEHTYLKLTSATGHYSNMGMWPHMQEGLTLGFNSYSDDMGWPWRLEA